MSDLPFPVLTKRFMQAMELALAVHSSQVRKGTSIPYISHLMAVASLVIEHGGSEDAAIAALLHDAPEDQGGRAMLAKIRAEFGDHVGAIVEACTDTFDHPNRSGCLKAAYIQHLAQQTDTDARPVSAADKVHNARAILHDVRAADVPAAVWRRFSAREDQIGWYYGSLERVLRERLEGNPASGTVDELSHALDAIAGLPSEAFESGLRAGRSGGTCV